MILCKDFKAEHVSTLFAGVFMFRIVKCESCGKLYEYKYKIDNIKEVPE